MSAGRPSGSRPTSSTAGMALPTCTPPAVLTTAASCLPRGSGPAAERELTAALEVAKAAEPDLHAEALARLAELRLAQGGIEEAARLLEGYADHPAAARVVGALDLARAEPGAAASVLARGLRQGEEESLTGAALSELLVEAEIAQGGLAEATARAERLMELACHVDSQLVTARAHRALGRARAAAEGVDAIASLEAALAAFRGLGMPFEVAKTRLLIAATLAGHKRDTAIVEARAALAGFEELGAGPGADAAAALLRSLGVKAARRGPKGIGVLTKRELEILKLLGEGLSNPAIAERLFITRKTVEHHVGSVFSKLELSGRSEASAYAVRHLPPERDSATK